MRNRGEELVTELREFALKQLKQHKEILETVKEYIDDILSSVFDIDPTTLRREDPATYYAIVMELTRSIFVNWNVEQRQHARTYSKKQ